MGTGEATASGLGAAGVEAAGELLNVIFDYIVPIVMVVIGVYIGPLIGLSGVFADLFDSFMPVGVSSGVVAMIAGLGALAIWAIVAGAFFYLDGKSRGTKLSGPGIVHWVMRAFGGLFAGFALGELSGVLQGKISYGQLSTFVAQGKSTLAPGK